jgi:hypothetical protein
MCILFKLNSPQSIIRGSFFGEITEKSGVINSKREGSSTITLAHMLSNLKNGVWVGHLVNPKLCSYLGWFKIVF